MDATRQPGDGRPRRTPAGDVILGTAPDRSSDHARHGEATQTAGAVTGRWVRVTAVVLGVLALAAVLAVATALAVRGPSPTPAGSAGSAPPVNTVTGTRPVRPYPDPGSGGSGSAAPGTTTPLRPGSPAPPPGRTTGQVPGGTTGQVPGGTTGQVPGTTTQSPAPADGPGGVAAARARVTDFVAALNTGDFARANSYLCQAMAGHYDESSLAGIEPGSLGVGGVIVRGDTGSAIVTYRPSDGSPESHALFRLTVERGTWMLCGRT